MPNELEKLLVTKYGVPEKQARNYAAQILGGSAGGHGDALKSEALGNVASAEQMRMNEMAEWAEIVARRQSGEDLPPEYTAGLDEAVADSADQTWQNAMTAPGPRPPQVVVPQRTFPQDLQLEMSGKRPFGLDTLDPLDAPSREPTIGPVTATPLNDPYIERLVRATQARKAMLGN